jgi:hypothetical protein
VRKRGASQWYFPQDSRILLSSPGESETVFNQVLESFAFVN